MSAARRILVVDDELPLRELMTSLLGRLGHSCRTASNAANALSEIERSDFDLAIIDLHMPGMEGDQLAEEIKKRCLGLPVLLMTGDHTRSLNAFPSVKHVLFKPFSLDQLKDAMSVV